MTQQDKMVSKQPQTRQSDDEGCFFSRRHVWALLLHIPPKLQPLLERTPCEPARFRARLPLGFGCGRAGPALADLEHIKAAARLLEMATG